MKTMMKKAYVILMAATIVCLSSILYSCQEDVTTTYTYMVQASTVSPSDNASVAIAQAIVAYQKQKGLLNTPFQESVDKEDLTDQEQKELDQKATENATNRLSNCNFVQIIKEAGITVPDNQPAITITYIVGLPTTDGGVLNRGTIKLIITPDSMK